MFRRLLNSHYFLWLLLVLPGAVTLDRYIGGQTFYGEVVHFTGEFSARLLIATLAITPLRLIFPRAPWVIWLAMRRRYLGVAVFGYAALHTAVYLARPRPFDDVLTEAAEPGMLAGWIAFALFIPLAITSNKWSERRLGPLWKRIHRWVYAAALLTFGHWLLVAFDVVPGLAHLAVLTTLETIRIWKTRFAQSKPRGAG